MIIKYRSTLQNECLASLTDLREVLLINFERRTIHRALSQQGVHQTNGGSSIKAFCVRRAEKSVTIHTGVV
jgi:hypothetical protein